MMSNLSKGIYKLDSTHHQNVSKLRLDYLKKAQGFIAADDVLVWNHTDDKNVILGAIDSTNTLIATLRVDIINSSKELSTKIDFDNLQIEDELPVGLLGKAVTLEDYQGMGLNSYLRLIAFNYLRNKGIKKAIGTIIPGAPRHSLMKQLGYQFIENKEGWRRYGYKSESETLICVLDLEKNWDKINEILQPLTTKLKEEFPIHEI